MNVGDLYLEQVDVERHEFFYYVYFSFNNKLLHYYGPSFSWSGVYRNKCLELSCFITS